MVTRRSFIGTSAGVCAAAAMKLGLPDWCFGAETHSDNLRFVDTRIATGGHGHCYPGATVPFGMVQLSPDTGNKGWDWCCGYHLSDNSIMGFSHTHLSGTGCGDLLDFLVMPGIGTAKTIPGTKENPDTGYRSRFSHDQETSLPGYYSVLLQDSGVRAELTATERCGMHRYTFPASDSAYIIVDAFHSYENSTSSAELSRPAPDMVAGGHVTSAWGDNRHAYFTLQVSKKPTKVLFYRDNAEVPEQALTGRDLKCVMYFQTHAGESIYVKTGISGVSAEGAAGNLKAEIPGWDFDGVRRHAEEQWRKQIGKVQVEGGTEDQKKIFFTALYHMSLGPTLFDDVDGSYRGMDNQVHTLPAGHHNYTTFSLWDTFRAAHPAYTLLEQNRVPHFVNTLIRMAEESSAGMPVWPLWGRETECMTGFHSSSVIAEACNKGFTGIDYDTAFEQFKKGRADDAQGLKAFREHGYIAADKEGESVSKSFEFCYDEWAIANVAHHLGKNTDAEEARKQSQNYRNYWDASVGFMRPKLADGSWASPFTPIMMGHSRKWRDYTESNAWQTTFGVQHDPAGLIELVGGREKFVEKLDELFTVPSTLPDDAPPDIAGMVGQYAHGNEPSHHIAYLYTYAGAGYKTQARVRSLMDTMYAPRPDGLQGNEDVGQMSAWYLLSALGFYPVDPVSGIYVVGSPLFSRAAIKLDNGSVVRIETKRKNSSDPYIQSFSLNGQRMPALWFRHADIVNGATLVFEMGPEPNKELGSAAEKLPPSLKLV